jgi:hypothetical protein
MIIKYSISCAIGSIEDIGTAGPKNFIDACRAKHYSLSGAMYFSFNAAQGFGRGHAIARYIKQLDLGPVKMVFTAPNPIHNNRKVKIWFWHPNINKLKMLPLELPEPKLKTISKKH